MQEADSKVNEDMVSIIIPLYNSEKFIEETINSILNQTYKDWELIVIDDGSTDDSAYFVLKLSETDQRIHYQYQKNMGVSVARNKGIKRAKGHYVFFLDADDVWQEDNLELKIQFLEKNKEIDWLFGSINLIDENSKVLGIRLKGDDYDILKSLLLWDGNVLTTPSTVAVRVKCLEGIAFDENLSTAADQDFVIQLASKYRGGYLHKSTVNYRVLTNSMSRNISLMEKDHIRVFKKARRNKLFKNFLFKQQCFSNLYWILAGSWWKDGENKLRGFYFILLALITNPFSVFRILKKYI